MTWRDRREFLKLAAVSVAATSLPVAATGCDDDPGEGPGGETPEPVPEPSATAEIAATFPQGLASGDPRESEVILWTRVAPAGADAETVQFYVAADAAFTQVVARGSLTTGESSDWTVRVKPTGLTPYTFYYYRFTARGVTTANGRTRTAPAAGADVPVRLAFASCQDFVGRYYHSWTALLAEPEIDFVVFLGDYIYETTGDPRFQQATDLRKITMQDGLVISEESQEQAALSLADYRGLYKQYRSDAELQKVHALYPFITIWDDHEFADDSWQDHSTHFNELQGPEQNTERRNAANQAWWEFQPVDVGFDPSATYPDQLTIYRSLRWGKHVELFLTDQRSYRADHLIPEGPVDGDVGKTGLNTGLGSRQLVIKDAFDRREAAGRPAMLGNLQKAWLINGMKGSDASWKLWGNETQLAQMLIDLSSFAVPDQFKKKFYFTVDQWDGYRTERGQILTALAAVRNLVALTGDIHAFYACEVHPDYDAPGATPTGVEFVTAGISSMSVQDITQNIVDGSQTLTDLGLGALVPRFDELLTAASPHYKYAKSRTNGVAILDVDGDSEIRVTFLQIGDVLSPDFDGTVERVSFRVASGSNLIEQT